MQLTGDIGRGGSRHRARWPKLRRLGVAAVLALACGAVPALAGQDNNAGNGYQVDHDGIYLTQQIGKCLNGTGACYYGGQCPGGEASTNAYANGPVYCNNFNLK